MQSNKTQTFLELKLKTIFLGFNINTVTFHLFLANCLIWLFVHVIYYTQEKSWICMKYIFFAKYQPSISYHYQIWRLILSSFMFQGYLQFIFNNSALNMLGYLVEAESRTKFIVCFYSGIVMGHLLSCCIYQTDFLTLGTSCGTIALLPLEICRFFKLKKTNPEAAKKRKRFIYLNLGINFILNGLAIFNLDMVDWISHVGAIMSGLLLMVYFQDMKFINDFMHRKQQFLRKISIIILILLYILMILVTFWYLPSIGKGKENLKMMEYNCQD